MRMLLASLYLIDIPQVFQALLLVLICIPIKFKRLGLELESLDVEYKVPTTSVGHAIY